MICSNSKETAQALARAMLNRKASPIRIRVTEDMQPDPDFYLQVYRAEPSLLVSVEDFDFSETVPDADGSHLILYFTVQYSAVSPDEVTVIQDAAEVDALVKDRVLENKGTLYLVFRRGMRADAQAHMNFVANQGDLLDKYLGEEQGIKYKIVEPEGIPFCILWAKPCKGRTLYRSVDPEKLEEIKREREKRAEEEARERALREERRRKRKKEEEEAREKEQKKAEGKETEEEKWTERKETEEKEGWTGRKESKEEETKTYRKKTNEEGTETDRKETNEGGTETDRKKTNEGGTKTNWRESKEEERTRREKTGEKGKWTEQKETEENGQNESLKNAKGTSETGDGTASPGGIAALQNLKIYEQPWKEWATASPGRKSSFAEDDDEINWLSDEEDDLFLKSDEEYWEAIADKWGDIRKQEEEDRKNGPRNTGGAKRRYGERRRTGVQRPRYVNREAEERKIRRDESLRAVSESFNKGLKIFRRIYIAVLLAGILIAIYLWKPAINTGFLQSGIQTQLLERFSEVGETILLQLQGVGEQFLERCNEVGNSIHIELR